MLKNPIASLPRILPHVLVLAALCGTASLALAQSAPSRIGFVTTERLMTESKMAKAADAKIQAEFSKRQKTTEEMLGKFKQMSEKFDTDAPRARTVRHGEGRAAHAARIHRRPHAEEE